MPDDIHLGKIQTRAGRCVKEGTFNKKDDGVIYEIMKRASNFEKRHFRD